MSWLRGLDLNRRTPLPARLVQVHQSPDELHVAIKIGNEKSASVDRSECRTRFRLAPTVLIHPLRLRPPEVGKAGVRLLGEDCRDTIAEFAEFDRICIFLAVVFWSG
jgi:hypothetical protein